MILLDFGGLGKAFLEKTLMHTDAACCRVMTMGKHSMQSSFPASRQGLLHSAEPESGSTDPVDVRLWCERVSLTP